MAGARGPAETMTSRAAVASAGQMQRQRERLVAENVAPMPPLVCKPSDHSLDFSGTNSHPVPVREFDVRTLLPQINNIKEIQEIEEECKLTEKTKRLVIKPIVRVKMKNANLKRLVSGAIAGAFSRTCVAPLETIRTHLMVGSGGQTVPAVFNHIVGQEGWRGLFRGNGVNVIRVAPSKAIEVIYASNYYFSWSFH